MSLSTAPRQRRDLSPGVARWRAAQARQAAKRRNERVRPWRKHGGELAAVINGNGYAGIRIRPGREGARDGER